LKKLSKKLRKLKKNEKLTNYNDRWSCNAFMKSNKLFLSRRKNESAMKQKHSVCKMSKRKQKKLYAFKKKSVRNLKISVSESSKRKSWMKIKK
jgi:hypothetical protein